MKRYQAVAFLLSTAMTVGSVAPVFGASNDVFGHWAEFTITKWQNEGRIGGYEDGTFKPDKAITRAEFVRLLNSAVPTAFTSSSSVNFSDVKESDWFFADVAQAVGSGVTSGFEDGTFRPGETVTRMQAAVFIAKAKGLAMNEAAANNFTDAASIPAWAKGAVGAAVSAGYLSGYPDGSFGGSKGMTRAEAVSTLDRVLGGTSTSSQTPSQGEVDTTDRDSQQKEETTTTANAGDMVWTSGGSGGGSRRGSSSSSSSSSSSNTISKNVTIRNQDDADDYKGKTLTGKATIYAKDGLELNDIRFKGDVDIIASSTATASAYIDEDSAVAAAYLANINIYFEGRTNVSGKITVIRDGVPESTQVVIRTRTPRAISAIVRALMPTRIVGFEVAQVEAKAPVSVAADAKVGTITADDGASVEAEGKVDTVNVTGDVKDIILDGTGNTSVKVSDKASVDKIEIKDDTAASIRVNGNSEIGTVAVSDKASAKVDVNDTAKVEKVDISDSATAKVDVAPEAKVDKISSTSTAAGSEVTGEGEIGKIESENAGTLEKGEEVTTPIETTTPDDKKEDDKKPTPPTLTDATATAEDVTWTIGETGASKSETSKITLKGAKLKEVVDASKWKVVNETDLKGSISVSSSGITVSFSKDEDKTPKTGTYSVTIPASDLEPVDATKDKIPADGVTATIKVEVKDDSVANDPALGAITATGDVIKDTTNVLLDSSKEQTVTLTTEATAIADGATINWTVNAGETGVTAPATSTVKDGKATLTLTVPQAAKKGEIKVTAALADDATVKTGEFTLSLISQEDVNKLDKVTITPATIEVEQGKTQDFAITVKDAGGKAMAEKTVTLTLNSTKSTITAKPAENQPSPTADGDSVTPVTVTTDKNGTANAVLSVGEEEDAKTITVTASCTDGTDPDTITREGKATVTVTPKATSDKATVDATKPAGKVTFNKDAEATATGTTTITFTAGTVKTEPLSVGTVAGEAKDIILIATKNNTSTNTPSNSDNPDENQGGGAGGTTRETQADGDTPQTPSDTPSTGTDTKGLEFTAAAGSDGKSIVITVKKNQAEAGTYNVAATINPSTFSAGAPDEALPAEFTVEVQGDDAPVGNTVTVAHTDGAEKYEVDNGKNTITVKLAATNKTVAALTTAGKLTVKVGEEPLINPAIAVYAKSDIDTETGKPSSGATAKAADKALVNDDVVVITPSADDTADGGVANGVEIPTYTVAIEEPAVTVANNKAAAEAAKGYVVKPGATGENGTIESSKEADGAKITTGTTVANLIAGLKVQVDSGKGAADDKNGNYFMFVDLAAGTDTDKEPAKPNLGKDDTTTLRVGKTTLKVYAKADIDTSTNKPKAGTTAKATYNVIVESNEISAITLTGLAETDNVKLEQDVVVPTIGTSTSGIVGATSTSKEAAETNNNPKVEWLKKAAPSSETREGEDSSGWTKASTDTDGKIKFEAGNNYKAVVTLTAETGKTFNKAAVEGTNGISGIANGLATTTVTVTNPTADAEQEAGKAATPATVEISIEFTATVAAKELETLKITGLTDPTEVEGQQEGATTEGIKVAEGEKGYKLKDGKTPSWGEKEETDSVSKEGEQDTAKPTYTMDITFVTDNGNEQDAVDKYFFIDKPTLEHDLKTPPTGYEITYAVKEATESQVESGKATKTEITFTITCAPKTTTPPAENGDEEVKENDIAPASLLEDNSEAEDADSKEEKEADKTEGTEEETLDPEAPATEEAPGKGTDADEENDGTGEDADKENGGADETPVEGEEDPEE